MSAHTFRPKAFREQARFIEDIVRVTQQNTSQSDTGILSNPTHSRDPGMPVASFEADESILTPSSPPAIE